VSWIVKKPEFYKTLLSLAVPMALQSILSMSVGFADNIMVGQLGERAVAGVMIANQVQSILSFLVMGISAALVVIAAQYWGKKDIKSVKAVAAIGINVAVVTGLLITAISLLIPGQVLRIFTNDQGVIEEGVRYIRILAYSYVFFCLTQTLIGTMRCVEVVRIGVYVTLASLVISVTGNYALIFGNWGFPRLGIEGAAIATLTARIVETIIMVLYVRFYDKRLMLRFKELFHKNKQLLADFFRYGLPVMGGDVSWGTIGTLKVAILGRLGESAMAANSIAVMLFAIITIIVWSASSASGVIIGKTVGSGDYNLVKQYSRTLQLIFVVTGMIAGISLYAFKDIFISLYSFTEETQIIARQFIIILSITVTFTSYHASSFVGIIRAGGDTKFVFIVDFLCSWCFVLPLSFIAAFVWNAPPWVVFLCIYSDQLYKWIIAMIKTNRYKWIKNLTRDAAPG